MIAKKCIIDGRVQGVYYRATAAKRAHELAISGHARNLADGRVEVLAYGDPEAVETYISWLWIGSSAARVISVDVTEVALEADDIPQGFHTL